MLKSTHFGGCQSRSLQRADNVRQLHSEPSEKPFAQTMNLAVARCCRERNGIEIIDNDPLSPRASIPPFAVSLEACANQLAVFFNGRFCAPSRRMAKFLQLYGERASSLYRHFDVKLGSDIEQGGLE